MKVMFFLFANAAVIDQKSNQMSLFNISEQVNASSFPVAVRQMTVVTLTSRGPGDAKKENLEIRLSLNGKKLLDLPFVADFQNSKRHRFVGEIQGLVLSSPGQLRASLRRKNRTIGVWDIEVIDTGEPTKLIEIKANTPRPKPKARRQSKKPRAKKSG